MLTVHLIDSMLKRQDEELQADSSVVNSLLHSVIVNSPEEELYATGVRELDSSDPRRRILGVRLIRELKDYRSQAAAALVEMTGRECDPAVLYWLVSAFGFLEGDDRVADWLRQHSTDRDPAIRSEVATALANCAGSELLDESLSVLLVLSRDENAEVRFSAVFE